MDDRTERDLPLRPSENIAMGLVLVAGLSWFIWDAWGLYQRQWSGDRTASHASCQPQRD